MPRAKDRRPSRPCEPAKREVNDMLKGIDPILNAEVLGTLRAMGHGDDLILCDMNFPAQSVALSR